MPDAAKVLLDRFVDELKEISAIAGEGVVKAWVKELMVVGTTNDLDENAVRVAAVVGFLYAGIKAKEAQDGQ